jgi:hypothetical protein
VRTVWVVAIGVPVAGLLALAFNRGQPKHPDWLGRIESWSLDFPFSHEDRAAILVTGLGDIRGLAEHDGDILLAEANGRLLKFSDKSKAKLEEDWRATDDEPVKVDQRGAAVDQDALFVAQYDRSSILQRKPIDAKPPYSLLYFKEITSPSGIVASKGMLYITDDRALPPPREDPASSDSAKTAKGSEFGSVIACPTKGGDCCLPLASSRLRHVSGIAADSTGKFLFVTEFDSKAVRWSVLQFRANQWSEAGALGSVPVEKAALPAFLGIAFGNPIPGGSSSYVFAAGPNSLYVFSWTAGSEWQAGSQMLGRMVFDDPVSGVAVHGKYVYLVVGHRLCRITVDQPKPRNSK